jgi:hypothetical protein
MLVARENRDLTASRVTLLPGQPGRMFDELEAWANKYNFAGLNGKKLVGRELQEHLHVLLSFVHDE